MSKIRTFFQGSSVILGMTAKNFLGTQANPTNGVKIDVYDPAGDKKVDAASCDQAQYDEDNSNTTGQYLEEFQLAADAGVGIWKAVFTVDPDGNFEYIEVLKFRVEAI